MKTTEEEELHTEKQEEEWLQFVGITMLLLAIGIIILVAGKAGGG